MVFFHILGLHRTQSEGKDIYEEVPSTARKLPSLSPSTCILIFAQSYTTPVSSDKTHLILLQVEFFTGIF